MIKAVTSTLALLALISTANAGTKVVITPAPIAAKPMPVIIPTPAPTAKPMPVIIPTTPAAPVVNPNAVGKPNAVTTPIGTVFKDSNGASWIVGSSPLGPVWNKY
jgi:hypothetical protein